MANINGVISLHNVVRTILLKEQKDIGVDYPTYVTFAIDAVRELNLYHAYNSAKVVKLEPDTLGRVEFPEDMIEFKALGIPYGDVLWSFTQKSDMITTVTEVDGVDTYDSDIGEGVEPRIDWYSNYGSNGGQNTKGNYYIDWSLRQITINGFSGSVVWLYYVSSGVSLDGATLIPLKYQDVIEKYVRWQMAMYNDDEPYNRIELKKRAYEECIVRVRRLTWTLDELKDVLRSTYQQTPHR